MTRIEAVVDDFLADKGKGRGGESGNYRRDAARELDRFVSFLDDEGRESFEELSAGDLRAYARHLARQGWTAGTVRTYYAYVSSFCGWAVREGYLPENIAQRRDATEPLPAENGRTSGEQQAWSSEDRRALTAFVDERAESALAGDDPTDAVKACRDRALVYLLSYSGVRGAEVLADPNDDRRDGLRWRDVHLDDRYVTVFAKKQRYDDRGLPSPVVNPMRRYRTVLDPPSDDWPVFPTFHRPTLARRIDTELAERGYDEAEIDGLRADRTVFETCLEFDVAPPSITTDAGRRILRTLCDDAAIDVGDDHDYLQPHGARRGAGEVLVRTFGHAAAARALDNSEEIVREHYSHIEAGDMADRMTDAFEEVDGGE
ncbi:tyrosine-type recombinase/integrase [Halostella litorea]|uniref:tyrosine-type recombinase/integrase n=1 Tax=Halostella litorea TaxID=2528831 RepID=UPI00109240B2|nr:site-specific integrase [Halostella litorea]